MNAACCTECGDLLHSVNLDDILSCQCGSISISGGKERRKRNGTLSMIHEVSSENLLKFMKTLMPPERLQMITNYKRSNELELKMKLYEEECSFPRLTSYL